VLHRCKAPQLRLQAWARMLWAPLWLDL